MAHREFFGIYIGREILPSGFDVSGEIVLLDFMSQGFAVNAENLRSAAFIPLNACQNAGNIFGLNLGQRAIKPGLAEGGETH